MKEGQYNMDIYVKYTIIHRVIPSRADISNLINKITLEWKNTPNFQGGEFMFRESFSDFKF